LVGAVEQPLPHRRCLLRLGLIAGDRRTCINIVVACFNT
jgi:hypothetical protein